MAALHRRGIKAKQPKADAGAVDLSGNVEKLVIMKRARERFYFFICFPVSGSKHLTNRQCTNQSE
jgi:hypothetical protein